MRISVLTAVLLAFAAGWVSRFLTQPLVPAREECITRLDLHEVQEDAATLVLRAQALEAAQQRNAQRMDSLYQAARGLEVRYAHWAPSAFCE